MDIDYNEGISILRNLVKLNIFDEDNARILGFAISPKALSMPIKIENKQRANILRTVLINYLKERR